MNKEQKEKLLERALTKRLKELSNDINEVYNVEAEIRAYWLKYGRRWKEFYINDAHKISKIDHAKSKVRRVAGRSFKH